MPGALLGLQSELRKTIVFITHDLDEALKLGDRIVILRAGRVVQTGAPEDILTSPADDYVARFVSSADVTHVLTAERIMKRSEAVAVLGHDGPRAALRAMRTHSITNLFVLDRERKFEGIVNAEDVEQLSSLGRRELEPVVQRGYRYRPSRYPRLRTHSHHVQPSLSAGRGERKPPSTGSHRAGVAAWRPYGNKR